MPLQATEPEGLERGGVEIGEGPFGGLRLIETSAVAACDRGGNRRGTLRGIATCESRDCPLLSERGNRRGTLRGIATSRDTLTPTFARWVEIGEGPFGGLRHSQALVRRSGQRPPGGNRRGTLRGIATLLADAREPVAEIPAWKSARDPSGDCDSCSHPTLSATHPCGNRRGTLRGIATRSTAPPAPQRAGLVEIGEGPFGGLRLGL